MTLDDGGPQLGGDQDVIEKINNIMKDAWNDDPVLVLKCLGVLKQEKPGKYNARIQEIERKRKNTYGSGLDKPQDFSPDEIAPPVADRTGDQTQDKEN